MCFLPMQAGNYMLPLSGKTKKPFQPPNLHVRAIRCLQMGRQLTRLTRIFVQKILGTFDLGTMKT